MKTPAQPPTPDRSSKKTTDDGPQLESHPESAQPSWFQRLWPVGVLILLAAVCFAPLIFSPIGQRIAGQDIAYYLCWLNQYTGDELLAGRLPLWNPYVYCGIPHAANPHVTLFYPPTWLYLLVPVISALPLTAGTHHVVCRYQPASVTIGITCTALAALAAVVIALWSRRTSRARRRNIP